MSAESNEKDKKEPFDYSWYLPVSGGRTRAWAQPPEPSPEPESELENEGSVESAQTAAKPEPKQVAASPRPGEGSGFHLNVSRSSLRIGGLSVWSIISGVGMIVLLVNQTPVPTTQVLALGGVWAAVSALIWFLPNTLEK